MKQIQAADHTQYDLIYAFALRLLRKEKLVRVSESEWES